MKSKFEEFVEEKRAVSPVIGVVLMVAVVVILAAVIGAFVLGLGGDQQQAPQASFSYSDGTLTMEGGDAIPGDQLTVNGNDNPFGDDPVTAGSTTEITPTDGEIRIVWDDGSGNSATLQTIEVEDDSGDGTT